MLPWYEYRVNVMRMRLVGEARRHAERSSSPDHRGIPRARQGDGATAGPAGPETDSNGAGGKWTRAGRLRVAGRNPRGGAAWRRCRSVACPAVGHGGATI